MIRRSEVHLVLEWDDEETDPPRFWDWETLVGPEVKKMTEIDSAGTPYERKL